jgi:hypothetical protein
VKLQIPAGLQAHAVWCPEESPGTSPNVVFVTERRWRRISLILAAAGAVTGIAGAVLASHDFSFYLAVMLVFFGAAAACQRAGRAGFYSVRPDGSLGSYLGRRPPDLAGMRRHRYRDR